MKNKSYIVLTIFLSFSFFLKVDAQNSNVSPASYIQFLSSVVNRMVDRYQQITNQNQRTQPVASTTILSNAVSTSTATTTNLINLNSVAKNIKPFVPPSDYGYVAYNLLDMFTINGDTGGTFKVGDKWNLKFKGEHQLYKPLVNKRIILCTTRDGGSEICKYADELSGKSYFPLKGYTDKVGNWEASGTFDESDAGKWSQRIKITNLPRIQKNIGVVVGPISSNDVVGGLTFDSLSCVGRNNQPENFIDYSFCIADSLNNDKTVKEGDVAMIYGAQIKNKLVGDYSGWAWRLVYRNNNWEWPRHGDTAIFEDNLIYTYYAPLNPFGAWGLVPGQVMYGALDFPPDHKWSKEWVVSAGNRSNNLSFEQWGRGFDVITKPKTGDFYYYNPALGTGSYRDPKKGQWMRMGANGVGAPVKPPFAKFGYNEPDAVDVKVLNKDFVSTSVDFTVYAYMNNSFTINASTTGSFKVGDNWTLKLTTNKPSLANKRVQICRRDLVNLKNEPTCVYTDELSGRPYFPLRGYIDSNGNWEGSGKFDSVYDVGKWVEYIKVADHFISNDISFTLSAR